MTAPFTVCDNKFFMMVTDIKGHPRTSHEDPEGEQMYSSTLPSTSALDGGVGGQRQARPLYPQ